MAKNLYKVIELDILLEYFALLLASTTETKDITEAEFYFTYSINLTESYHGVHYRYSAFHTSGNNCVRICKTALCHLGTTESIELPDWRRLTICIATNVDLCLRRRTLYARIAIENWRTRTHANLDDLLCPIYASLFMWILRETFWILRCEMFLNINSADFFT